jgi:hypothetical protein
MLLAQIIASIYLLFGLFGLVVVSVPGNYSGMFWQPEKPWVGLVRLSHAYIAILCILVCGASVWLFPNYSAGMAILVLCVLIAGKAIGILAGSGTRCARCLAVGVVVACLCTWAIVAGTTGTTTA